MWPFGKNKNSKTVDVPFFIIVVDTQNFTHNRFLKATVERVFSEFFEMFGFRLSLKCSSAQNYSCFGFHRVQHFFYNIFRIIDIELLILISILFILNSRSNTRTAPVGNYGHARVACYFWNVRYYFNGVFAHLH